MGDDSDGVAPPEARHGDGGAPWLLVVNPASGRGRGRAAGEALARALRARGEEVESVQTSRRGSAGTLVRREAVAGTRVVAVGGDGTLNEVLEGVRAVGADAASRPALGFLPAGTANAAARAFGFALDPARAARALHSASPHPADVGLVDFLDGKVARPFLLWCGAGFDGVVIEILNAARTGLMGRSGLLRAAPRVLRALSGYAAPLVSVEQKGQPDVTGRSAFLANVGAVAFGGMACATADPRDGALDLVVADPGSLRELVALGVRTVVSDLAGAPGVVHRLVRDRVRLTAAGPVPVHVDGEPVGSLPCEVRVDPGSVRLLTAPSPAPPGP